MSYDHRIVDLIYRHKRLVTDSFCEDMIKLFEDNIKIQTTEDSYKFDNNQFESDNYKVINLFNYIEDPFIKKKSLEAFDYIKIMLRHYKTYIRSSGICKNFDTVHIEDSAHLRLIKYEVGSHIKDHADQNSFIRGSISINLNNDYEGGSLKFFGDQHFIDLDKAEGILFPAEPIWIHGTKPITKGHRYVLNCFLRSNPQKLNNES
mgnify:CR=1 FL=1|jgi:hypothetical protein|tara:strand:- start:317 stop:931 length:615 start_codon:yes stop_codon:yes gene_type:complete